LTFTSTIKIPKRRSRTPHQTGGQRGRLRGPLRIVTAGLLLAIFMWSPKPTFAYVSSACGSPTKDTVAACLVGGSTRFVDASATWPDNNLELVLDGTGKEDRFISNSMWVYTDTTQSHLMEEGNTAGVCWALSDMSRVNICPGVSNPSLGYYYRYYSDMYVSNSQPHQWVHWFEWWAPPTAPNPTPHTWGIYRDADYCSWDAEFDGKVKGVSHIQYCPGGVSYGYEHIVGLETYATPGQGNGNYYSDTVTDGNLRTWHDGAWHSWEHIDTINTSPCSQNVTTNCFDGTDNNTTNEWAMNRPR
jgi:hypothetical protein